MSDPPHPPFADGPFGDPGGRGQGSANLREERRELVGYLSDAYPPAMVAHAVEHLLEQSPELACETIVNWSNAQLHASGHTVPVSDFLYHSVKKVDLLDQLGLTEGRDLSEPFARLTALVRQFVPEEELEGFDQSLTVLRESLESTKIGGVDVLHRPRAGHAGAGGDGSGGGGEAAAGGAEARAYREADVERLRQLSETRRQQLASRGGPEVREQRRFARVLSRAPVGGSAPAALRSEVLSAAAHGARTAEDLRGRLDQLREAGFGTVETPQVLRALTEQVPDLHVAPRAGAEMKSPTLDAVERVVHMSRDHSEEERNISEVVRTAVEHFNNRGLGRAMTILHLSVRLLRRSQLSEAAKRAVCQQAGQHVDLQVLHDIAKRGHYTEHLRTFLGFFPQFELSELYELLIKEPDRRRRHELLSLIRLYGEAAYTLLSSILVNTSGRNEQDFPWYVRRNLLYLMRQTLPERHVVSDLEYEAIRRHTDLGEPYQVVREALAMMGRLDATQVDRDLGGCLIEQLKAGLHKTLSDEARDDLAKLQILTLEQLLERRSPVAREIAFDHILKDAQWQDAYDRLLRSQASFDFRHDPAALDRLLEAVRERLPRFKLMKSRLADSVPSLLVALSGTPSAEVVAVLQEVAARHPSAEVKETARRVRGQLQSASLESIGRRDPQLQGDLEAFGLPALLQSLEAGEQTGTLELRAERATAVISIWHGKFVDARNDKLLGLPALYALFQRPFASTFAFVSGNSELAPSKNPHDLTAVMLEATRRADEYQSLRAELPDGARLAVVPGVQPTPSEGESDGEMIRAVWLALKREASPIGCEQQVEREPYRLRRLLVHWLELGALEVVEQPAAKPHAGPYRPPR
ncbi:MAG TPA: DUF4388 domain-containing protein [Thermoanaerobaculia bacterium]|nr:DUF4388 domain-containing protein [Thermoanaerobaculia bacterium]